MSSNDQEQLRQAFLHGDLELKGQFMLGSNYTFLVEVTYEGQTYPAVYKPKRGHRHQHQGKVFNVKVQLTLPGDDVVVDMERPDRDGHEDVYVVLRDAFDAAKRQLQARMAALRNEPNRHEKLS